MLDWLSVDGKKLLVTRILRTFAYGYLAVVLGLYLDKLGMGPVEVGLVFTAAIAGSAVMTIFWSIVADRYGRRRTVATMAILMFVGGLVFALTNSFWMLMLGAFTGTISATSSEVGVFQTVEQAVLPQTAPNDRRTWLFSIYNTAANFAGALGSLAAASVGFFAALGLSGADAFRPLFVLYALIGLANFAIFVTLSDKVELAKVEGERRFIGIHRSTGTVAKLSLLFGLDSFAGGFVVQSVVAYWFYLRWGLDPEALAGIFFWVGILSGLSLLAAGWLAERIGLLNTMVFTHLPSQIEMRRVPQPAEVLNRQRIVQAELVPELRDELLLRRAVADAERGRADHRVDRISRDQVQDREHQQRGEQQHRNRLDKPLRDELGHAPPLVPAYTLKLTSSSSSRPPARPVARAAPAPPAGGRCGR